MRHCWRAVGIVMLAAIATIACRERTTLTDFGVAGLNPAVLITRQHERHVVYVDHTTRRLMHHRLGDQRPRPVSPAGDRVDLRGENAPLFASLPDDTLLVIYPIALPGGLHHRTIGELRAQVSRDRGRTWSAARRIDGDTTPRSHNFADLAATPSGELIVSWLDSRAGKQGVQTAVLRPDLTVQPAQTVDPKSCQCCRTALLTTSGGDVWLAYRDLAGGDVRNMAYAVSSKGRQPFVPRGDVADDRWSVNGCPESGPRFAETSDGTVWLAWFNGAANAIETAAAPRGGSFARQGTVASGGVNHPDIGTLPDGRLLVVYEAFRGGKRAIEARVSDATHTRWSDAIPLAADGASPRYVRRGNEAVLSYITSVDGAPHVRLIDPLPGIPGR
jgi:hypothetical protein